ncbi:MAG: alpha-L-rhamnosidase N-terminal domain-containing protein [Tannerella sp.]|nr:alpha-L-rhamnosidase N-terminal domain-containing protein [Tannerella sp.]
MKRYFILTIFFALLAVNGMFAQSEALPNPALSTEKWEASWITCPHVPLHEYGVYHFRKTFDLEQQPSSFIINISADNRYRLFVNGQPVCWGPARGDVNHWYFETVDIAASLKKGQNAIAVIVWNFGDYAPGAQMTLKTGLIVQGNSGREKVVNTDRSWKALRDEAYSPSLENRHDVGCGDRVDASLYPWGWEMPEFNDSGWQTPLMVGRGQPYGSSSGYDWVLCPRDIPLMEETPQRMATIRRAEGIKVPEGFLKGTSPLVIPAHQKVSVLIDQQFLTTAYPELITGGGRGSRIILMYSEAMFKGGQKANRNDIDGREMTNAFSDHFLPDGGSNRLFRPLWFKTWRYIRMDIQTADEPLTIHDLSAKYTGYPFRENASFESDRKSIGKIWETGWRTARLCAHETYFDCPYYEQLQYVGDTRIQSLISLYVDGDDRLMRKAIRNFGWSRSFEGITASRYPSRVPQYIPPFSLYWVNMVHDYWMHRDDEAFINECIQGVKTVLEWYAGKVDAQTGMLGATPHWNFVDWPPEWPWDNNKPLGGVPPGGITGGSSILTLQFAYTLKDAIELLNAFGEPDLAKKYANLYQSLIQNTWKQCWDDSKQLISDDIVRTSYSQHANIMGILSDAVPQEKQRALFDKLDSDPSLIQATFYYRFYLFRALKKVGLSERYVDMLKPWDNMIAMGLTTFAENPEPTRSDCHAWSSSPNYDLLATVCGIEPAEPGFRSVKIEPHIGSLKHVKGKAPHPKGIISVDYTIDAKGRLKAEITLPEGLVGVFIWKGKETALHSGQQIIQ